MYTQTKVFLILSKSFQLEIRKTDFLKKIDSYELKTFMLSLFFSFIVVFKDCTQLWWIWPYLLFPSSFCHHCFWSTNSPSKQLFMWNEKDLYHLLCLRFQTFVTFNYRYKYLTTACHLCCEEMRTKRRCMIHICCIASTAALWHF